ncbi:DUF6062 family protein [Thermococcus stetteri]|uniref:DUF6062 family protein n=1 Tax=Thermococcus stetteri TaxID=49900 RepID=UPI001AEAA825|nr:DUF6062 family protein [Thermococcus stetteri]MBP1912733.1 ElaB/YqjD/DUF883 family membrane-anchored ribosome-binding protein [Thermococcus stetteri]
MDLIGVYLQEAIDQGCPVCRILRSYEESQIDTILYEHVNDPEVRKKFRESLGLCTYHAWMTLKKAYSEPLLGPLGVAIIYEDVLSKYIDSLEDGKIPKEEECFLCKLVREKERDTIEGFAERMDELLLLYENSEAVLCRRHYEMLLSEVSKRDEEKANALKEIQVKKLKRLQERLKSFVDKFDYRSQEEPTKEEVSSLPLAIEALKGLEIGSIMGENESCKERRFLKWR